MSHPLSVRELLLTRPVEGHTIQHVTAIVFRPHIYPTGTPPHQSTHLLLFSVNEEAYVYEEEMTEVWQELVKEYMRQQRCAGDEGGHNSLLLLDDYKVH